MRVRCFTVTEPSSGALGGSIAQECVRRRAPPPTSAALAQTAPPPGNAAPTTDNAVLLTVFFKHDQSRPLNELNAQLEKQGYYKSFPPPGIEVVSWYVMMGIGQEIT